MFIYYNCHLLVVCICALISKVTIRVSKYDKHIGKFCHAECGQQTLSEQRGRHIVTTCGAEGKTIATTEGRQNVPRWAPIDTLLHDCGGAH